MDVPEAQSFGRTERMLMHPGLQRAATFLLALVGLVVALGIVATAAFGQFAPQHAPATRFMGYAGELMLAALALVGGVLGLYLSVKGHRRALTRLLGCASAGIAATMLFFAVMFVFDSFPAKSLAWTLRENFLWVFVGIVLLFVLTGAMWIFSAVKFFLYFPRPVKLMGVDMEAPIRVQAMGWRWIKSFQFAALVAGIVLVVLVDSTLERLRSSMWTDAAFYLVCWLPFATVSAKERALREEDRRAIRWVLLGQSIWLALFLASTLLLLALLWSGALVFAGWNDSAVFVAGYFKFFYAGFLIVLMLGLAISILYDGTLDPDLMIRRTWMLAVVGLVSGSLFVVLERLLAHALGQWIGISTVNALTILAAVTAILVYPARSWIEQKVKDAVEHWQASYAIAEGERREAVIVFADLTGYTALTERNEREALIMAAIYHRDAQRIAKARGGHLIKTIGDAVMLRFGAVDDALQAISDLKRDFDAHVRAMSMEPLLIHAGLHYGEVVIAPSGDVFGSTVNLAARLAGAAGTSDVIASRAVVERSSVADRAEFIGEKKFKNVELPVGCFRLAS